MPFKSKAQRAWMHINKPKLAKKFEKHTPKGKKLPKYAKKKKVKSEGEDVQESFISKLDQALGLFEAKTSDPQATTHPQMGAKKGVKTGQGWKYSSKKKKKENKKNTQIKDDVLTSG